jgi:hypothetical protein
MECTSVNVEALTVSDIIILLLFILTANGFLPDGSDNTIRHNKQITYITQNNTTIKRNTAHKTTHTIKDRLHRMTTNNQNYVKYLLMFILHLKAVSLDRLHFQPVRL